MLSRLIVATLLLTCLQRAATAGEPALSEESRTRFTHCYKALPPVDIEKHRVAARPIDLHFDTIDVSDKIRSASFGHTTTLLVPAGIIGRPGDPNAAMEFYVEYGKSTNTPGGLFGPFKCGGGATKLSEARRAEIVQSFQALSLKEIEAHRVATRPIDLHFDTVDVTLLVPAGIVNRPGDPNAAKEFYVRYGKTGDAAEAWYGPFKIK